LIFDNPTPAEGFIYSPFWAVAEKQVAKRAANNKYFIGVDGVITSRK
jgi:hypothetical protein